MKLKKNKYVIIASIAIAIIVPLYFFIRSSVVKVAEAEGPLAAIIYSFLVSISIFSVNIKTIRLLQVKYPWGSKRTNIKRLISEFFITNIFAAIVISIYAILFGLVFRGACAFNKYDWPALLFQNIMVAIIINTIATSIIEGAYMFRQWREALVSAERFKQENIKSQLNTLRHQLDPHFLFNSLNTLYSIIDQDKEKAKQFIKKFSDIYRYVLDAKDQIVIALYDEINFLHVYFDLIAMRYGDNIKMHTKIEAAKTNMYLPPLSLQLLLENAVKHNIISSSCPLIVELYSQGQGLIMKHKLQPKEKNIQGSAMGQENLIARYQYICNAIPKFYVENNYYIAYIPLIEEE